MASVIQKYRSLVELAPDPIFLLDLSSATIVEVNRKAAELLGYDRSTLEGMNVTAIHPEGRAERYRALFTRALDEGVVRTDQFSDGSRIHLVTNEGQEIPVEIHARIVEVPEEVDPLIYGIVRDLTGRLQRERKLRQFRAAVEETAHGVYITDTDGVIEYVNSAFQRITGYRESDLVGETPHLFRPDGHDEDLYEQGWKTVLDGDQWHHEIAGVGKDGEQIVLDQTISPLTDDTGTVEKVVAVAQDITERKRTQTRLQEQRDALEVLNQVVRHDIRNDLQVVKARAELLEEHVPEEGRTHLETLVESAENAIGLTTTARELAQVLLRADADASTVRLDWHLEDQLAECRQTHPNATIRIDGSLPPVEVVGNEMLGSVFRNLLENAIQHHGGDSPEVTVSVEEGDEQATVRVADDGPGVPDAQKGTIFGRGERGLQSDGTGLGLYLVQSLVSRYGGSVSVADNDPEGAVFVVRLPRPA